MSQSAQKSREVPRRGNEVPERKIPASLVPRQPRQREMVQLREKVLKNGRRSLYLDFRFKGKRIYDFLKLYIEPETSPESRRINRETMKVARMIQSERHVQLVRGLYGLNDEVADEVDASPLFYDLFRDMMATKGGTTRESWRHALLYARKYDPRDDLRFSDIDFEWLDGFFDWLDKEAVAWSIDGRKRATPSLPLNEGTKALYFRKVCSLINVAHKRGYITRNPVTECRKFYPRESERVYLTADELRTLADTRCDIPIIKETFLFCCLTGLRWSDMTTLRVDEVREEEGVMFLQFRQTKTSTLTRLDLNAQAAAILRQAVGNAVGEYVWGVPYSAAVCNYHLAAWVARAGIEKKVTWHSGRHTFAMLLIDAGVDLYAISKLLGHRDLKSTQVYAQIHDRHKAEAVARLPDIF